jgi:hypothetical protein
MAAEHWGMGFNKRKLEDQRRQAAEKKAAARRATDAQVLEDAEMAMNASTSGAMAAKSGLGQSQARRPLPRPMRKPCRYLRFPSLTAQFSKAH